MRASFVHTQTNDIDFLYDVPDFALYRQFYDAVASNDIIVLYKLAENHNYLAYRASLYLVKNVDISVAERLHFYNRMSQLRIYDPLAREENRKFMLELADSAEQAGQFDKAIVAYAEALPTDTAISALKRLQTDPYQLLETFLQARLYQDAHESLKGHDIPSLEALVYRGLKEYSSALDAYGRWKIREPTNITPRLGVAWSHFHLGHNDIADALFSELSGRSALYGRGLIAKRRGNLDKAVTFLLKRALLHKCPKVLTLSAPWQKMKRPTG